MPDSMTVSLDETLVIDYDADGGKPIDGAVVSAIRTANVSDYANLLADKFGNLVIENSQHPIGYPIDLGVDLTGDQRKMVKTWLDQNVPLGDPSYVWDIVYNGDDRHVVVKIRKRIVRLRK